MYSRSSNSAHLGPVHKLFGYLRHMSTPKGFTIILLVLAISPGCKKETNAPTAGGAPWMSHIAAAVDSAFIQAPNVVTPNADGVNDVFHVVMRNVTSAQTTVLRLTGETVFNSSSLQPVWDDLDSTDLGRYQVKVSATSISGSLIAAQSYLDVIAYSEDLCLPYSGSAATGDQFDPRVFGVTFPTNEIFCE